MKSITLRQLINVSVVLLLATLAFASGFDKVIVGKSGEVVFSEPHRWGDTMLPAGHYQFQHRAKDGKHFVHFKELRMIRGEHMSHAAYADKDIYPDVACTTEPLGKKSKATAVHSEERDGVRTITRIEIRGENVAHVF